MGFTWLVVEALRAQVLFPLTAASMIMGLAALVRSITWLFAPVAAMFLFIAWRGSLRRRLAAAGVVLLPFALVIAPWSYRNTKLQETFVAIDVMGGRNAMMGNYEYTPLDRSWAAISITDNRSWDHVLAAANPEYAGSTQGQRDKLALRHAIRFVLAHPWLTIKRDVVKFFNFWQLDRTIVAAASEGVFGPVPPAVILAGAVLICGTYAIVLYGSIFGVWLAAPDDWRYHGLFLLTVLFPCAIHALIFAHSRYNLPIMPIVMLYASSAFVGWNRLWEVRRSVQFAAAAVMCVIVTLAWAREIVFVDLQSATALW
jgi:hypothetical protein